MNKKYELTHETVEVGGSILYRIRALRSFSDVKAGELGGFIESEANLYHRGNCWISDNSRVYGNAEVSGNARVSENAQVSGESMVFGCAQVYGNAEVSGWVRVFGNAHILGDACIFNYVYVYEVVKLDHGIWNRSIPIDGNWYLISTTLEKVLVDG